MIADIVVKKLFLLFGLYLTDPLRHLDKGVGDSRCHHKPYGGGHHDTDYRETGVFFESDVSYVGTSMLRLFFWTVCNLKICSGGFLKRPGISESGIPKTGILEAGLPKTGIPKMGVPGAGVSEA